VAREKKRKNEVNAKQKKTKMKKMKKTKMKKTKMKKTKTNGSRHRSGSKTIHWPTR
jgi:hypothetical protein